MVYDVTGAFGWIWANIWALAVGGFIGHLFGEKIADVISGLWRRIGG